MPFKDKDRQRAVILGHYYKTRDNPVWNERAKKWRMENPHKVKEARKRHLDKMRELAFQAYGDYCVCCGESERAFLTFDHINGGGHKERAKHGSDMLRILHNMGYPPTIQILCANCNMAKQTRGKCPHHKPAEVINIRSK